MKKLTAIWLVTLSLCFIIVSMTLFAKPDEFRAEGSRPLTAGMANSFEKKNFHELAESLTIVPADHSGGPDSFGYTYIDNNVPAGPTYEWIEISDTGTEILPSSDDDWIGSINLGFFFNYYGTDYSQLAIGNNGLLFSGIGTSQYVNDPITQSLTIHGFIAPYWDDLVTWGSAGAVHYLTLGTAPNRKFVVEWYDNQHYHDSSSGITFEVILSEGTNNILLQYEDVDFGSVYGAVSGDYPPYDNGGSATVGIEDPTGNIGLQYSFDEQVIVPGLAVLFRFPAFSGTNMHLSMNAPASMVHGNTITYSMYYNDFGSAAAPDVVLQAMLSMSVDFVSASDGGTYDPSTRRVTWTVGLVPAFPSGRGSRIVTAMIPSSIPVSTVIQTAASISTSILETRYDDNSASSQTTVTGSNLPPNVGVGPTLGNSGGTPSVYWTTPITFTYYNPTATSVDITIHLDDGGTDITGSMAGGPPMWMYTTTFYPRHGHATTTYTVNDPTPYSADFDVQSMRGFENTITAAEIEDYIRNARNGAYRNSPMLQEAGIGERFVTAGRNNHVNPAFLVATAELEGRFGVWWDNNGDGNNDNWAYTHPQAHNTMGWGVPLGSTPMGPANTFDNWGDCIEHVAQQIASPNGDYYGSGLRTVHDIRGVYVGGPNAPNYESVQFIVNYMNNLAQHAGQAGIFTENFNLYIDPAGYIYDTNNGQRISGASVWLQRSDGEGGWENVPTGINPSVMQPDVNPQITGADGQYQWDVLEGSYRVHVEAFGYYPANSIVVTVPPPVTDLHVGLTRLPDVAITNVMSFKTVVGQNFKANVTVTAANRGSGAETFNVTLYAENQTAINQTGLVGYWEFDEGSGTIASDSSGNNNHGTINGAVWTGGRIGSALQFDGIDDYVQVPDSAVLNITNDEISIAAWVKMLGDGTNNGVIVCKQAPAGTSDASYSLDVYPSIHSPVGRHVEFAVNVGGRWTPFASTSALNLSTWNQIVGTYDGSNVRIFINGVLDTEYTLAGNIVPKNGPLYIGHEDAWSPGEYFNGTVDEVKIYNRALSVAEIWEEYAQVQVPIPTQTQTVTLENSASTTLTFTWNTSGFAYGNYTLSAYAWPVPGETNTTDNTFISATQVHVGVPGDVSGPTQGVYDGTTNMRDINYLILLFNTNPGSPNWKPNADINNDGTVNMRDIQIAILNFNKHE